MAAIGTEFDRMHAAMEHAVSAAMGSHGGVRLWMLDCGHLVQKHREHAAEASIRLGEQRERAERAEAKLAEIETLAREERARYPAMPVVPVRDILAIVGGEDGTDG